MSTFNKVGTDLPLTSLENHLKDLQAEALEFSTTTPDKGVHCWHPSPTGLYPQPDTYDDPDYDNPAKRLPCSQCCRCGCTSPKYGVPAGHGQYAPKELVEVPKDAKCNGKVLTYAQASQY